MWNRSDDMANKFQRNIIEKPKCFGMMAETLDEDKIVKRCMNGSCIMNGLNHLCLEMSLNRKIIQSCMR